MGIGFPMSFYEKKIIKEIMEEKKLVCPLRNTTVIARFIPREGSEADKRHVLFGGMAETATRTYTVPLVGSSNSLKNVLTTEEKDYFESVLGVNLSVLNKKDNYWVNFKVRLNKGDNFFDLSQVEDYLKYKVLLANDKLICRSLEEWERRPLATYQYVMVEEGDEMKIAVSRRQLKKECFKLAGKISDDFEMLKAVVEMLSKRPISQRTNATFLADKLDEYIDENAAEAYKVLNNPSLKSIVFIKRCVGAGLIIKTGDFYYLKSGRSKTPMAEDGKDPVIEQAIAFLKNPKNQETKFALEAQLKNPATAQITQEPEPATQEPEPEETGAE